MVSTSRWRGVLQRDLRGRAAVELTLWGRGLDPRPRKDPDFIIVGAQKAGTSSLFAYLASQPRVAVPVNKEVHYFSLSYGKGQEWYRRNFPLRSEDRMTGEATPVYMVYPRALERIAADLPHAKVVVILRHPVRRLVSHYRHSVRLGRETLSLGEALAREEERLAPDLAALAVDPLYAAKSFQRHSYLYRSRYSTQVERVQRLFGDRALFLRLEDVSDQQALRPLVDFLGLPFRPEVPFGTTNANPGESPSTRLEVPQHVVDLLEDDGRRTTDLLGWEPWVSGR